MQHAARPDTPALVGLVKRIEAAAPLDVVARAVAPLADALVSDPARDALLRGAWLGHAVHPLLTDLPIGLWTSATVLDAVGGRHSLKASQRLVGLGVLAAGPAAVTGWAEWSRLGQRDQRVGLVHAVSNISAVTLYAQSWRARRSGRHLKGIALSLAGGVAMGVGGYLGGHLNEARKVASAHPDFTASGHERPLRAMP